MLKKFLPALVSLLCLPNAYAAYTQVTVEAEQVSGGTIISDVDASNGSAVTRTTDGIYTWWISETSALTTGSYSVYVRAKLSSPSSTSASFGPQIVYGTTNLVNLNAVITNHTYQWVRVGSFDLGQIGGQLRIGDWSSAGLTVDKLAIVKDVSTEAELATGGTIITDTNASGGRAVSLSAPGGYSWWLPAQSELKPGDYMVQALLASADGAAHNFGEVVSLDNVDSAPTNLSVSATGYQWYTLNSFSNAGGTQSVRVSDYSEGKLKLDKVRLVRRTPYEKTSATQALYAAGANTLGPREQVVFNGIPTGFTALKDPGRVSIVQANASTTYAYFRQELTPPGTVDYVFQIYMATSTDGGKTFTIKPDPVIQLPTALGNVTKAYDQQVTKRPDGTYYMVFEGVQSSGCTNFSALAASSPDGVNWTVKNTPICATGGLPTSVPNYYFNVETNQQYIQWAAVDVANAVTRRYQYALPGDLLTSKLNNTQVSQIAQYAFPQAATGSWESNNNSAGTTIFEDGYYYLVYDGSSKYNCTGRWGLGVMRSNTPGTISTWAKSTKNPFLQANLDTSCWLQYPDIVSLPGGTYIYYQNAEVNYGTNLTIFRNLISTN